ncbi:hypothetical protein C8R45DRAFT_995741, partial [Mycena sanguinolenta]
LESRWECSMVCTRADRPHKIRVPKIHTNEGQRRLFTRNPPFSQLREIAASLRVIQGERPEQPPAMPAALWQLVTAAWAQDFLARPSVHDIVIALEGLS